MVHLYLLAAEQQGDPPKRASKGRTAIAGTSHGSEGKGLRSRTCQSKHLKDRDSKCSP